MKKRVIAVIAAAVGVVTLLSACKKEQAKAPAPKEAPAAEEQRPAKVENDPVQQEQANHQPDDVITTVYGELKYPGMWTDRVYHEVVEIGGDVRVHFYGIAEDMDVPLFTLCYGTVPDDGFEMGALKTDGDVAVPVSTLMHPIRAQEGLSEETIDELNGLQESVNILMEQIRSDPNFEPGVDDPEQPEEQNTVIETAYGQLEAPGAWKNRIFYETEQNGSDVKICFYSTVKDAKVSLFTLCYGTVSDDAYEMGTLKTQNGQTVSVSMVVHPIEPQEGWSDATVDELHELQEGQNDLLTQFWNDPNFTA